MLDIWTDIKRMEATISAMERSGVLKTKEGKKELVLLWSWLAMNIQETEDGNKLVEFLVTETHMGKVYQRCLKELREGK